MWPCFSCLFLVDAYLASKAALDWEIRISDFAIEREIRKRISPSRNPFLGWIFIKKSKFWFHGFTFYRSLGKSEKRFAKLFWWKAVFCLLIMRARAGPLFLRTVFQILFRISQSNGKKKIQKHISQHRNPFSDFAFDKKSEMQILNSNSRFPNRQQPAYELLHFAIDSSNTALTRRCLNRLKLLFTWYSWTPSYGHPVNTATFLWPIQVTHWSLLWLLASFLQATKRFTWRKL